MKMETIAIVVLASSLATAVAQSPDKEQELDAFETQLNTILPHNPAHASGTDAPPNSPTGLPAPQNSQNTQTNQNVQNSKTQTEKKED